MREQVPPGALIARMPSRWDRLRAVVKIVMTAITSRRDKVLTLTEDGRHIALSDTDKIDPAGQVPDESETETTESAAPGAESSA